MASENSRNRGDDRSKFTGEMPRFYLPEVIGTPMSREELAGIVQRSVAELARSLQCARLLIVSYVERSGLLCGVTTFGYDTPDVRDISLTRTDFPAADRAITTCQVVSLPAAHTLPPIIAPAFAEMPGDVFVLPLVLGERVLALCVGQLRAGLSSHNPTWRTHAAQVADRAALMAEVQRLASEYHEEVRRRLHIREIAAAMLEGRPLTEAAGMIVDFVAERLREERVGLYLLDREGMRHPLALRNVSCEYAQGIVRLAQPIPTDRALATNLPIHVRNVQFDPEISEEKRQMFQREQITSLLMARLQQGDRIQGVLVVYPRTEREFTPAELSAFQSFADFATVAIAMSRQMGQQREMATVEERNRLAREMHDTVAQSLAGLVMQIEMARRYVDEDDRPKAQAMLTQAREQARKSLEETRRAVQGLAPAALEAQSPAQAIAQEAALLESEYGITTQFVQSGEEPILDQEQRTTLLRVAQEALSNARRHAQPQRIRVGLQYAASDVTLLVEDDGVGFDTSLYAGETPQSADGGLSGYGLFGMRQRTRLVNGELNLESTPGWGTRLRVVFPIGVSSRERTEAINSGVPAGAAAFPLPASASSRLAPLPVSPALRVLIADDHVLARQGLRAILEAAEFVIAGEAVNGAEAFALASSLRPDVVLMDLQMPGVDGLEGLRRIHAAYPALPVVIVTTFPNDEAISQALASGARGFLLKDAEPADLIGAVRAAYRGESLLSASVTDRLAMLAGAQEATHGEGLNEREREILELLAMGARNKEIAARLFIAPKTVEYHLSNLFGKLGVSNRTEAARIALERGMIAPGSRLAK